MAWLCRFVQDDAFISFRYAENLCNGLGLTFNVGEYVEGYTNFLWTLLIAAGLKTGIGPVLFTQTVGLCLYPVSLYLLYQLGIHFFKKRGMALSAVLLTATNYTYASYATGGLETHMQSFLCLLAFFLYYRLDKPSIPAAIALSFVLGLAFLLRMDSALLVICLLPASLIRAARSTQPIRNKVAHCLALCTPAAILAGTWLVWKIKYYGHILPNTFAAKNPDSPAILAGLYYLVLFIFCYGFFLMIIPAGLTLRQRKMELGKLKLPLTFSVLWMLYIIKMGGGFMEFRLWVPIIPLLSLAAVSLLYNAHQRQLYRTGWLILFATLSLFHSTRTRLYGVESIKSLNAHVTEEKWCCAGKALNFLAQSDPPVRISTTAAGAIAYYAQLPTVDMLGLNDAWIANHGAAVKDPGRKWLGAKPGHQKKATLDYLLNRQVHLLVGHPRIVKHETDLSKHSLNDFTSGIGLSLDPAAYPPDAKLVRIPIDKQSALIAVYLTPHPAIEQALKTCGWTMLNES